MRFFKALFVLITLTFFVSLVQAASSSETVEVIRWDESNIDVVIARSSDENNWLLHLEDDCVFLEEGIDVRLTVEDLLDGYGPLSGDKLSALGINSFESCPIDAAQEIDDTLFVHGLSGNYLYLRAENNSDEPLYQVRFSDGCDELESYKREYIYLKRYGGSFLNKGDKIILPDQDGQCSILVAVEFDLESGSSTYSVARPSIVQNVRILAADERVKLYWDQVPGADRYLIGYSNYPVQTTQNTEELPTIPNILDTKETSFTIENLKNNKLYFFYVAAEKSGETSRRWSEAVSGTPQAYFSYADILSNSSNNGSSIFQEIDVKETDIHFIFKWSNPTKDQHFVLSNEKGTVAFTDHFKNNFYYFLKTPQRKGNTYTLDIGNYPTVTFGF